MHQELHDQLNGDKFPWFVFLQCGIAAPLLVGAAYIWVKQGIKLEEVRDDIV